MNNNDARRLGDALIGMRMIQDNLMYLMRSEGACTTCAAYKPESISGPPSCAQWNECIPKGSEHNGCEYWRTDDIPF